MGRKTTFVLDEQLITEAKEVVARGLFRSVNALVESALRDELEKIKKERIREALIEASRDPMFLSDIKAAEKDFRSADSEGMEE